MSSEKILPTKKQKKLLAFIDEFIKEHGYSPSYREIMVALNYTSVATVALHVNSLITRGHLQKRGRSARSLEVINVIEVPLLKSNVITPSEEKWLIEKVEHFFEQAENAGQLQSTKLDEMYVLTGALKVLGLTGAAQSFIPRLTILKKRVK